MAMRMIFFLLAGLIVCTKSNGQVEVQHHFNFVIMVDGKIPLTGDIKMHFIIENENQKLDTVSANYVPGDVYIQKSDIKKLQAKDVNQIRLEMDYRGLCRGNIKSYIYIIEFYKSWFQFDFAILRIYNFDKKKYRKIFFPVKDREYTYEFDTPNGSMIKVRKKNSKKDCDL